ncbi:hypothetical protein VKT23_016289 [Stygiomarasmius scandens]|uniref:Uncharacterized protein n=1 Tax=Marasmiellus scandens TaxID=2682957 RepID=A0ABR1IY93_9AGAR
MAIPPARTTAADVRRDPQLLLHSACPEAPLTPFDGRVGAVISTTGYVVTSPNMDLLYSPGFGTCATRMRRDYHFGTDDPLYFPQPFNIAVGHLAIIPAPSPDSFHNQALAWYRPKPSDFLQHDPNLPFHGLEKLSRELITRFETMANRLVNSALERAPTVKNDRYVRDGRASLQRLVERLQLVSTRDECLLLVACLQRQYLELYARLEWLDLYQPRIQNQEKSYNVNAQLMGAFAYNAEDVQRLFHAGIPVWYVRDVTLLRGIRVDTVADPVEESANQLLPMRNSDKFLDLADASPPHRVVWTGGWTQGERYAAMGRFIRSLHEYRVMCMSTTSSSSPVLAITSSSSSSSSSSMLVAVNSLVDVLGTGVIPSKTKKQIKKPYSKSPSAQVARNKFLPFAHPLNPPAADAWSLVLSELSPFHETRVPEQLGYYLPPPELLISSDQEATRTSLVASWVKLRSIFLWLLSNGENESLVLKGQQWRSVLDLAHGLQYQQGSGTQTSRKHTEMQKFLENHLSDRRHGVHIEFGNLPSAVPNWRGQPLLQDGCLRPEAVQEVLWELYEISFRIELMTLDRKLLPQTEWALRQNDLADCWCGLPFRVNFDNHKYGLAAPSFTDRLPFIRALYYVVKSWPGPKPDHINFPFPVKIADGSVSATHFEQQVEAVEEAVTRYYVRMFFNAFARAPTIPHRLDS